MSLGPAFFCRFFCFFFGGEFAKVWDEFQWTVFLVRNDLNVWIPLTVYQFHLLNSLEEMSNFADLSPMTFSETSSHRWYLRI